MTLDDLRAPLAVLEGEVWVVGGGLRDALMGRPVSDVDLAVNGDGRAFAERLARATGARRFRLSAGFGAWRVQGGTLPFDVDITPIQGGTLGEDLRQRDLTVNAMALPLRGPVELVDPFGGRDDLAARCLRAVDDRAFARDPVRLLRAARLAAQLGMVPEPATVASARAAAPGIWEAPGERLRDELLRMARLERPAEALRALDGLGALGALVPELEDARGMEQNAYHHRDVLGHTLEVVEHGAAIAADPEPLFRGVAGRVREVLGRPLADGVTRGQANVVTCLLHDMAKPATRAVTPDGRVTFLGHDRLGAAQADALLTRLRVANRLRSLVVTGIREHLRLGFLVHRQPLSLRQFDRYLRATQPAEVELMVLSAADRLATNGPRTDAAQIRRHLTLVREAAEVHFRLVDRGPVRAPLGGDEIAAHLGRAPGPWLAALMDALREEQLIRPGMTARRALAFGETWMKRHHDG